MKEISVYRQLVQLPYLPVYYQLIRGAMELDVFSRLTVPVSAQVLAEITGWNGDNTKIMLDALCSAGFLERKEDEYVNTEEAYRYLVSASPEYAGGFLLMYMKEGMASLDVARLVREGADRSAAGSMKETLDFTVHGESFRAAQRGCRSHEVLQIIRGLPENGTIRKVLDIGCNTGLLGLSVIRDAPERTGILFDMPPLGPVIDESIRQEGMEERAQSREGDFLTDDLGSGYDLILAVSVMLFARKNLTAFLKKLHDALAAGGVVVCIGEGVKEDLSEPWDMIMGFLPYWLQGLDIAIRTGEIEACAVEAGFTKTEIRTAVLCTGTQDIIILRK